MKIYLAFFIIFLTLTGCEQKHKINLDGEKLLDAKCSMCHNLDLPPKTFEDEKAPPMMAVAFHIKDFIEVTNDSERIPKGIEFIKDYVINPSAKKSFCDKKSLDSYGIMPSQKGKVIQDELEAIDEYMFEHYTIKNLTQAQALKAKLDKMPKGKRIALQYNCLGCHKANKDLVGPSFVKILSKYKNDTESIKNSIKNGSKGKWQGYRNAVMPHFKDKISDREIDDIVKWIEKLG